MNISLGFRRWRQYSTLSVFNRLMISLPLLYSFVCFFFTVASLYYLLPILQVPFLLMQMLFHFFHYIYCELFRIFLKIQSILIRLGIIVMNWVTVENKKKLKDIILWKFFVLRKFKGIFLRVFVKNEGKIKLNRQESKC